MPKIDGMGEQYEQIIDLVHQLEFEKQILLMKAILSEHEYRENLYRDTEDLRKNIKYL